MYQVNRIVGFLLLAALTNRLEAASLDEIRQRGSLVMISFPHQESHFVRPDIEALRQSGKPLRDLHDATAYSGVDVEIMTEFAHRLGVKLEMQPILTSYADLIPALLDGQGDLIASSLTITESRRRQVAFSKPYLESWVVVGTLPGNPLRSIEDLAGLRAAAMRGSSQLENLQQLGIPKLEIVLTDYTLENYLAIEEGRADFALFDSWHEPGELVQKGIPKVVVAFRLRPFEYGYALPPGSDLLAPLNEFLAGLKKSGKVDDILTRHVR
jgi:glutamine transport system substrate-binding protein